MTCEHNSFCRRCGYAVRRFLVAAALAITGCTGTGLAAKAAPAGGESSAGFVDPAAVDQAIPTPQSVIGHPVAEQAVRYPALIRYLRALADASPLVTLTPYAVSHEGRDLYYLTIASRANHARLEAVKADNAKLADPRTLSSPE
ncbi:MAG: hypothetical protein ACYSVY_25715, partial [Planctomycetota bacterium]